VEPAGHGLAAFGLRGVAARVGQPSANGSVEAFDLDVGLRPPGGLPAQRAPSTTTLEPVATSRTPDAPDRQPLDHYQPMAHRQGCISVKHEDLLVDERYLQRFPSTLESPSTSLARPIQHTDSTNLSGQGPGVAHRRQLEDSRCDPLADGHWSCPALSMIDDVVTRRSRCSELASTRRDTRGESRPGRPATQPSTIWSPCIADGRTCRAIAPAGRVSVGRGLARLVARKDFPPKISPALEAPNPPIDVVAPRFGMITNQEGQTAHTFGVDTIARSGDIVAASDPPIMKENSQ
jgi:hypothetical protein